MERILTGYEVNHATWFYLSFLLIVAVFFRFHRVWSLRNLDLALLLAISPAILLLHVLAEDPPSPKDTVAVNAAASLAWWSMVALIGVSLLWLVRLFCDGSFVRRPRLEQNLNAPGLAFLGIASFAFLTTAALRQTDEDSAQGRVAVEAAENLVHGGDEPPSDPDADVDEVGPAVPLLFLPTTALPLELSMAARLAAILSHLAVVVGLAYIGWVRFADLGIGIGMGTLYLLLPATSVYVGEVNHVLPAALVVWAFATVRQPILAGTFLGLASGTQLFALFLVPLWCTWYGRKGAVRFASAWGVSLALVVSIVAITASRDDAWAVQVARFVDWASFLTLDVDRFEGAWRMVSGFYRIPVFVAFLVMLALLVFWPITKNLDQLIARSAAIVVGMHLWYPSKRELLPDDTGTLLHGANEVFVLWYLPLLLLVVFRPNLDRVTFEDADDERVRRADPEDSNPAVPVGKSSGYVFR